MDLIHGHSSHHPRPLEIYNNRLILYGCGDFINDYEGIGGHEEYRGDLAVMYFPELHADSGAINDLTMVVLQRHRFSLRTASDEDTRWLRDTLNRHHKEFGVELHEEGANRLTLQRR